MADLFEDVVRTVALFHRVGDVEDYVRIVHGAGDEFHHRFLEFVAGFQDARRIREDDLEIFAADHSQNAVARGLGLEVMIERRSPTSAFINVDLPTLGFPMILTKPALCIGCLLSDSHEKAVKARTA